jgi:L-alanine-DL-glutamate epimerase-like enolase superfamily enzyme
MREERPVWALFPEPPVRPCVESYATFFGCAPSGPDAAKVANRLAETWTTQKWNVRCQNADIAALRRALPAGASLALDCLGVEDMRRVESLLVELAGELAWIEEPYSHDDLYKARTDLFRATSVPHAAGELCYGPSDAAVLAMREVDIWQPDAVFCGGFRSLQAIVSMAEAAAARCMPHGGGFLPAVHAAFCGAAIEMVEFHMTLEPIRQAHLASWQKPGDGGILERPDAWGWGGALSDRIELVPYGV